MGKKLSIDTVKQSFAEEGYQLLTTECKKSSQKLELICPQKHKYLTTWNRWQQGKRCFLCSYEKRSINRRLGIDVVRLSFEKEKYLLLTTEYRSNKQKLEFICPKDHRHSISWINWQKGQRCGICSGRYLCFEKVKDSFERENYHLLTTEYNNNIQKLEYVCPKNHFHDISYSNWQKGERCGICSPKFSRPEKEILKVLGLCLQNTDIIENDRTLISPYELDIAIPEKEIAIEYCGLYWHSELSGKDRNYHLNKLNECTRRGYCLITIFEDEWLNYKDVVISRLKNLLGVNDSPKIYARDCRIEEIDKNRCNEFLNKFHLQGKGHQSFICLGAFYRLEIVSVMTFSKPSIAKGHHNKNFLELNRFCSHSDYRVVGIASKLLSYFERNYSWDKIISYADRRWSNGNMYYKLGFDFGGYTQPNYWYFSERIKRVHRFSLRKKYDEPKEITEWDIRQSQGYNRIWDCGNIRFRKEK
jgi:hypothetical protein